MKKFSRKFFALFSACVISVACALPAFAAQTDISNHGNNLLTPGKILKILVETDLNAIKYYSQFPDPLGQYEQDFTNGGMLAVNPDLEALDHVFCVIDVTATTLNPQNQYFGKVLRLSAADGSNVTGRQRSIQNIDVLRAAVAINSQYVKTAWGDIYLIPLFFSHRFLWKSSYDLSNKQCPWKKCIVSGREESQCICEWKDRCRGKSGTAGRTGYASTCLER